MMPKRPTSGRFSFTLPPARYASLRHAPDHCPNRVNHFLALRQDNRRRQHAILDEYQWLTVRIDADLHTLVVLGASCRLNLCHIHGQHSPAACQQ